MLQLGGQGSRSVVPVADSAANSNGQAVNLFLIALARRALSTFVLFPFLSSHASL